MNCREASDLMHRYMESKLSETDSALLEQHTAGCKHCRNELELLRRLYGEQLQQKHIKAPGDFTDNVMAALYKLPPERRPHKAAAPDDRWKLVYRRMGYSLILTAGIIMFSLLLPVTGIHPDAISGRVQSSVESPDTSFEGLLTNIDNGILRIFKSLDYSNPENKGGTDNGM